ncbi:hypothetical protein [Ligilactobacillus equi]|nr:hypothetical protein [Ligilactobacillus equi]
MRNMASVEEAFEKAWKKSNPSPNAQLAGMFPRVTTSVTNNERKKLESYIVADGELGENELSNLPSTRSGNRQDRTHLIPLSVTGVENHRALLIMFDSYLNQHNLKDFEERNIDRTKTEDIIWWVVITRDEVGHLDWYYNILDRNGNLIEHLHVKDDRWYYKWYYDSSYQELGW